MQLNDEALRLALLEAARQDCPPPDGTPISWGARYLRRRRKMLRDPGAYLRAASRPAWQKALRYAAAAILALGVLAGGVLLNPEARAYVSRFFVQWFDTNVTFAMTDPEEEMALEEITPWKPAWLPEGYEEVRFADLIISYGYTFSNGDDRYDLYVDQSLASSGAGPSIDNEHSTLSHIFINGYEAILLTGNTENDFSYIFWVNDDANLAFTVSGRLDPDTLIKVAESIAKK